MSRYLVTLVDGADALTAMSRIKELGGSSVRAVQFRWHVIFDADRTAVADSVKELPEVEEVVDSNLIPPSEALVGKGESVPDKGTLATRIKRIIGRR